MPRPSPSVPGGVVITRSTRVSSVRASPSCGSPGRSRASTLWTESSGQLRVWRDEFASCRSSATTPTSQQPATYPATPTRRCWLTGTGRLIGSRFRTRSRYSARELWVLHDLRRFFAFDAAVLGGPCRMPRPTRALVVVACGLGGARCNSAASLRPRGIAWHFVDGEDHDFFDPNSGEVVERRRPLFNNGSTTSSNRLRTGIVTSTSASPRIASMAPVSQDGPGMPPEHHVIEDKSMSRCSRSRCVRTARLRAGTVRRAGEAEVAEWLELTFVDDPVIEEQRSAPEHDSTIPNGG